MEDGFEVAPSTHKTLLCFYLYPVFLLLYKCSRLCIFPCYSFCFLFLFLVVVSYYYMCSSSFYFLFFPSSSSSYFPFVSSPASSSLLSSLEGPCRVDVLLSNVLALFWHGFGLVLLLLLLLLLLLMCCWEAWNRLHLWFLFHPLVNKNMNKGKCKEYIAEASWFRVKVAATSKMSKNEIHSGKM